MKWSLISLASWDKRWRTVFEDKAVLICRNCLEAASLDRLLSRGGLGDWDTYQSWIGRIDRLYRYCPGKPWCENPDELKNRKNGHHVSDNSEIEA